MNKFDNEVKKMIADEECSVPENVRERIEAALNSLPEIREKKKMIAFPRALASVACAAVIALFVLPNISSTYAHAAEKLPIIGSVIRVLTFRDYSFSNSTSEIDIKVPYVDSSAAELINKDAAEIAEAMVGKFKKESNAGYNAAYLSYEVVTDTDTWFTLRLEFSEVQATGANYYKYYHIDKERGEYAVLGDLFNGDEYIRVVSDEILRQMKARMAANEEEAYLIAPQDVDGFKAIDADQNFYFDPDGNLVIVFNEYEVSPGYMGCPEFTVKEEVYENLLR